MGRKGGGPLTRRDDDERFARAMEGVRRIAPDPRGQVRSKPEGRTVRSALPPSNPPEEDDADDSATGFVATGIDRRELRKLKRGDYTPGKRLDLHGMTAVEALASVTRLIEQGRRLHRCVCIVHGRGLHSQGNHAVLKTRVREFVRQHRNVLAYADAPRNDGGAGAVYVLLRK
jgi:DNA-nicking Smr family endonuclease